MTDHLNAGRKFSKLPKYEPETKIKVLGAERDLSKIPRWARDAITKLQADVRTLTEKVQARQNPADARVIADPYSDESIGLRDGTTVRFKFEGSNGFTKHEAFIDVRADQEGKLMIYSSDQVLVLPVASNSLAVTLIDATVDRENAHRRSVKEIHGVKGDPL